MLPFPVGGRKGSYLVQLVYTPAQNSQTRRNLWDRDCNAETGAKNAATYQGDWASLPTIGGWPLDLMPG